MASSCDFPDSANLDQQRAVAFSSFLKEQVKLEHDCVEVDGNTAAISDYHGDLTFAQLQVISEHLQTRTINMGIDTGCASDPYVTRDISIENIQWPQICPGCGFAGPHKPYELILECGKCGINVGPNPRQAP